MPSAARARSPPIRCRRSRNGAAAPGPFRLHPLHRRQRLRWLAEHRLAAPASSAASASSSPRACRCSSRMSGPPRGDAAEFLDAFDIGPMRTMEQDVEFGVLQLVDIALKAISPAVNDPSTAINCIDQLSRLLARFAAREPAAHVLFEPPGVARVILPAVSFAAPARGRLLPDCPLRPDRRRREPPGPSSALRHRIGHEGSPLSRGALLERGRAIGTDCLEHLPPAAHEEVRVRLQRIVETCEGAGA